MDFTPDEFSLQLSWCPRVNGVKIETPGFYLRGAYSNEGDAMSVVRGTWNNGRGGHGSLVGTNFLEGLAALMERDSLLEPSFSGRSFGRHLADFQVQAQRAALERKRARLEALRQEVDALEAELGS